MYSVEGGQYTNLQFQAFSLGLADQFEEVKQMYRVANLLLGDIVKVSLSFALDRTSLAHCIAVLTFCSHVNFILFVTIMYIFNMESVILL